MENASTTFIVLRQLAGNDPVALNAFQSALAPYEGYIGAFWFSLWCMTAVFVIFRLVQEYRARNDV